MVPTYHDTELLLLYYFGVWTRVGWRPRVDRTRIPRGGENFCGTPCDAAFRQHFLTTCSCSCSSSFTVKVCVCVSGHCSTLWNRKSKAPSASHYPQWTVHDGANVVRPAHSAAGVRFSVSVTVATRRWRHATIILVAIIGLRRERKCADTIGTVSVTRAGHFQR